MSKEKYILLSFNKKTKKKEHIGKLKTNIFITKLLTHEVVRKNYCKQSPFEQNSKSLSKFFGKKS